MGWCIHSRASHKQLQQTAYSEQHSPAQSPNHQSARTGGKDEEEGEEEGCVRQPQYKT